MSSKRPTPTKRERARNEQALKELLKVPGNDRCADCNAMNPGWASWSIGVFLCTRCASIHRKLGTHISKVKSLSLDNWESEQVDVLRLIGNIKANAVWNPDPSKHPIPLNTEESDSVMEGYVRNKYEYKLFRRDRAEKEKEKIKESLSSSRDSGSAGLSFSRPNGSSGSSGGSSSGISIASSHSISSYTRPQPPNRSVSASFHRPTGSRSSSPPSKIRQVLGVEPVHQQATLPSQLQQPTTAGLVSLQGISGGLEDTIRQLKDMGFIDDRRIMDVLKQTGGNVQTAIDILTRMGGYSAWKNESSSSLSIANQRTGASVSANPFDELDRREKLAAQQQALQQQQQILQQQQQQQASFGVSNPYGNIYQQNSALFPHRTGPEQLHANNPFNTTSSIPPTPSIPSQYQHQNFYSPFQQSVPTLPLVQSPIQSQSTGLSATNPYSTQASPITDGYNPFMSQQPQMQQVQQQQQQYQMPQQASSPFDLAQPTNPQQVFIQQPQHPNAYPLPGSQPNGFFNPQQELQQPRQPQQLMPQPTGRLDKAAILSLYNMPHLAPTPPRQPQPEPQQQQPQQQQQQQQQPQPPSLTPLGTSNAHLQNLAQKFANTSLQGHFDMQRSNSAPVPMPQSNNPFQQQVQPPVQQNGVAGPGRTMGTNGAGRGHMTQESVDFGNWMSQSGRHSPDAFASLSFRQM